MASERNQLPGSPSNTLIKAVRKVLWNYIRSRPQVRDQSWQEAWQWADNVRSKRWIFNFNGRKVKWPSPQEIATQYIMLSLQEMHDFRALRLPFHAEECVPESVKQRIEMYQSTVPALIQLSQVTAVKD